MPRKGSRCAWLGPVKELKQVVVMGLVCLWLCVPGKSTHTEHPVWELAGRMPGEGRRPSITLPEQASQSSFVVRLLFWKRSCPGLFALQLKGQLLRRISQTTHLRLSSLDLGSHSHFSSQAQTRGDKLLSMHLTDKSCRTRPACSWLPKLLWQETTAQ